MQSRGPSIQRPQLVGMHASTSASASTSFAKLLKNSKVVSQHDPAIPSLVYTSHGGSFKRSDFGLKRALPRMKSPAIKVASLDSPTMKLTDFEYGSRELQFVKRWREAGYGISGADPSESFGSQGEEESLAIVSEQPGACTWDRDSFQTVQDLKDYAKTGKTKAHRLAEAAKAKKARARSIDLMEALEFDEMNGEPGSADFALQTDTQTLARSQWASAKTAGRRRSYIDTTCRTDVGKSTRTHDAISMPVNSEAKAVSGITKDSPQHSASSAYPTPGASKPDADVKFSPNYLEMSDTEFTRFLSRVRSLRPQYRQFLRSQGAKDPDDGSLAPTEQRRMQAARLDTFDVYYNATNSDRVRLSSGARMDDFLNKHLGVSSENRPSLEHIRPRPHHSLGLSYQPPNLYQTDVANRTVPLRVLQQPKTGGANALRGTRHYPISVFGTVNDARSPDLLGNPTTAHYVPDADGNLNTGYGQMIGRVEVANVNPEYVHARAGQYDSYSTSEKANSFTAGRGPSSGDSPAARSILDDAPISIKMYASRKLENKLDGQSHLTFRRENGYEPENRIGGKNWVEHDPEAASAAARNRPIGDMLTSDLFGLGENAYDSPLGRNRISPPNPDEVARPDGYVGGRAAAFNKVGSFDIGRLIGKPFFAAWACTW